MAGDDASTGTEVDAGGFEFAFDNEAFSDRVLRIEIVGSHDAPASGASRKRRREDADGDDGKDIDSSCTVMALMGTPVLRVNTIHISSAILAAQSTFFLKLFSNGMKESDQRHATVTIADSEEKAFIELLRFMYSGKLTPTTEPTLLVDILMAADKFEVVSCMKLCGQRLIDQPMTPESAVRCLDIPRSISMASAVKEVAKTFLAERYKEFLSTKFQDELMRIPLAGIQVILSRNRLGIESEGSIYDFLLRWACLQYPNSEQRHKILSSRLLPLVPRTLSMTDAVLIDHPSCIINFTIKREKCLGLFPSGVLRSQPFHCAGRGFCLLADCKMIEQVPFFAILVKMLEEDRGAASGAIDYIIGFKTRPSLKFSTKHCRATTSNIRRGVGCMIPWSKFIADDSHFIDGKVHLRVQVKITPEP
ncbi:unnamed protein product [Triticum turgidum subsp. durum]|uniref:BTB domain-containing protein n=1 Tax=Triticum turgidum subsp. durum TaxID=4567 RepID=A0A9R0TY51_TRITD|nr:unnamed protein product [Triticum turgidum subsp. durum]